MNASPPGTEPGRNCFRIVVFLLTSVAALADLRTSANYSIATETADRGGARTVSAAYTNDGSAGGVAGISSVAAPAETARLGYIGQLYEVTALQITATPALVNEGSTTQLSAVQLLDDATTTPIASGVSWSVQNGPLSGITGAGVVTATPVFQDTTATLQGLFGTLNLTVLNTNPDNYGLFAGDGLPDDWQNQYFAANPANAAPAKDPDGDGQANLFEYTTGTAPNNAGDKFLLSIATVPGQPARRTLTFTPRLTGRTYTVQTLPSLTSGPWQPLTGSTTSDNGTSRTVTDTSATAAKKVYRVEVTKP